MLIATNVDVSETWNRSLPAAVHCASIGGMLRGDTACSSGYSIAGVRDGSVPTVALPNWSAASPGAGGTTTSPTRLTPSSAVPDCIPHVAVTFVLPPCGSTVAVAFENVPKFGSSESAQLAVISVRPDAVTP